MFQYSLSPMAGLYSFSRPASSSLSSPQQTFSYRLLLLLTLLPLSLALLAFILQWRGGLTDPTTLWPPDSFQFPGMAISGSKIPSFRRSSVDVLSKRRFPAFPYFKDWNFSLESDRRPKLCITSSTSAGLEQTLPWIYYHKVVGVSRFFLFVEGKAASPNASKVLESVPGVKVIYRTKELQEQQAKSRIWNESWLTSFLYKPCNYELFVKQAFNMEMAIVMARDAGMDWIFHLDTDELMHPAGAREYSLRQLMSDVPKDVDMVVFPNHESAVEQDDIVEPFAEVSLFKKNYDHVAKEVYFGSYKDAARGNDNYFMTYGNGKSAARVQDHLRPNGAHRWHNYKKSPNEIESTEAAVLHYSYSKFSDLTSRRDRCGCKPTMEDLKRCFMLEFDRSAFIIASTATEEEMLRWYREHVVWTDTELKLTLLKRGVLTRIYTPMAIIQGLKESGVFDSIIQSAQTSVGSSTSNSSTQGIQSSKKIGGEESHSRARRMLEVSKEFSSYDPAIPPLSPPVPLN